MRRPGCLEGAMRHEILERVSDAFVALDRGWRYVYVNGKAGELFGRRLYAESTPGAGATFLVELPHTLTADPSRR